MKRTFMLTMLMCLSAIGALAQTPTPPTGPATTAGQVCRVTHSRTKPGKGADFTRFRREHTRPILEEQKKQGLILSYTYYTKPVNEGPNDWDLAVVTCFKNYADAIDFNAERGEKFNQIGLKHYGSDDARTKANNSLNDVRDVISSILIREQILNPIP
jgi:hypothetical protein